MTSKFLLPILLTAITFTIKAQSLYVDASVSSSGGGNSWNNAYKTLSEALNAAWQDPTIATVYVAKGTYAPNNYPYIMGINKIGTIITSGITGYTLTNYDKTFHIRTGLEVYGGYPPGGGTRNIPTNETILNASNGCYHVVLMDSSANWAATNDTTILDGFTVTGGYANGSKSYSLNGSTILSYCGGGFYIPWGTAELQNNNITSNACNTYGSSVVANNQLFYAEGGGVYSTASIVLNYNKINGNSCVNTGSLSAYGGGVYATKTTYLYNNSINFNTVNSVSGTAAGGGFMAQNLAAATIMIGNFVLSNSATVNTSTSASGSGIYFYGGTATLTNNVVSNNTCIASSGYSFGAGIYTNSGTFTFNNNTIYKNSFTGTGFGAGIASQGYLNNGVYNTTNFINNCIFWGNMATSRPDIDNEQVLMNVKNSSVQLSSSSYSSANANQLTLASTDKNIYSTDPLFTNTSSIAGADGIYGTTDDGLILKSTSLAIDGGSNYLVPIDIITDITNNARIQNSIVDMGAYESSPAILPLTLLNFSGNRQGNSNLLQWTTSNEVGTKTFVVESSANGNSFAPIGDVVATGGGKYAYTDNNPIANRTYYRLKMVDVDGKFTYSNIIWISINGSNTVSVYPNPVGQTTTLNISNNNQLIGTTAQLTDVGGRLLQQISINHSQEQLNMAALPAGLYLLKLNDGTVVKMMKQ